MALRLNKPRDVEKASYYVWFLGALEARGLRGRQFVTPVVQDLMRKEEHVDPSKVTLQVSDKGLKIVQHVSKKGGKGRTEPVKHFIPDHAITFAVQEPAPDRDIVSCILLIFNPVTKCPVHVHTYRCDSAETAAALAGQLRTLAARPDNRAHIEEIEARLLERGLLEPPPGEEDREAEKAGSSGGRSGGSGGAPSVPTLYDSLADELRTKINGRKGAPLLLPPKDYDTSPATGKAAPQEDSSGIGSDDAPSPDHRNRDRERTSSGQQLAPTADPFPDFTTANTTRPSGPPAPRDEEWEAAGHSSEDLLLVTSPSWRQGSGWGGGGGGGGGGAGRRSAGARSADTDELLTPSSRKSASQRQRSPSASPQDRFQNARLKFVQMEQKQEPVLSSRKPSPPDLPSPEGDRARACRRTSSPDVAVQPAGRQASADAGWRLPQPSKTEASTPPARAAETDERGWRRPPSWREASGLEPDFRESPHHQREHRQHRERTDGRQRDEREPRQTPEDASAEEAPRRGARGRPHVADIFRHEPAPGHNARNAEGRGKPHREDDARPLSDVRHEERGGKSAARATSAAEKTLSFISDSDPRPDEVHARVDRWVRSSAQATPFTKAMSFEESRVGVARSPHSPQTWDPESPVVPSRRVGRHPSEPSEHLDEPSGGDRPHRLSKSRSTDAALDSPTEPRWRSSHAAGEEQWRRSSAQITAELRQRSRGGAEPESAPRARSPVARHHSSVSAQSDPRPAERRIRYQELPGSRRLPGLDRESARDPLASCQDVAPARQRPAAPELDYRREPGRRRDRSCDVRAGGDQRRAPTREQRRDESEQGGRPEAPRPRSRHPEQARYRSAESPVRPVYDNSRAAPSSRPDYEARGRPRRNFADTGATQFDYRNGISAYPY